MTIDDLDVELKNLSSLARSLGLNVLEAHFDHSADAIFDPGTSEEAVRVAKDWGAFGILISAKTVSRQMLLDSAAKKSILPVDHLALVASAIPELGEDTFKVRNCAHVGILAQGHRLTFQMEAVQLSKAREKLAVVAERQATEINAQIDVLIGDHARTKKELEKFYGAHKEAILSGESRLSHEVAERALNQFLLDRGVPSSILEIATRDSATRNFLRVECRNSLEPIIRADIEKRSALLEETEIYPKAIMLCKQALKTGDLPATHINAVRAFMKKSGLPVSEYLIYKLVAEL